MIPPFKASRLKIERAQTHIFELEIAVENFFSRKPCAIVVEPYFDGSLSWARSCTARVRENVPYSFSPIIGDIIHNLRTALDLLACDLVRLAGKNPSSVYFPFCERPTELHSAIKKKNIHRAGHDVVEVIERFQPYRGGNETLRALHDMDVSDKHKSLSGIILIYGRVFGASA